MPESKILEGRKVGFDPECQELQSMRLVTRGHGREHMIKQKCSCNDGWEAKSETGVGAACAGVGGGGRGGGAGGGGGRSQCPLQGHILQRAQFLLLEPTSSQ